MLGHVHLRSRFRRLIVPLLVVCLVSAASGVAASGAAAPPSPFSKTPHPTVVQESPTSRKAIRELGERESAKRRALKERRDSPEGRAERDRSRSAHDDLSDGAAVDLLRDKFGSLLEPVTPDAETLFAGAPVEEYLGDYTARLGASGDKPARLIESQVPLRTPVSDAAGAPKQPVDLDLVPEGGHFAPDNGIVKLEVPENSSNGIRVGPATVVPGGGVGVERVDSDTLAYPNISRDTDLAVNTTATGFETFHQLRGPEAPERQRLRLALPPGAVLRANKGGGAEVVQDGKRKLSVSPPVAVDAQGQELSSTLDVEGDTVVIKTPLEGKSVAWPAVVDPEFTVKDDWANGFGSGNNTDTWTFL